jgi:hypothetical protein
MLRNADCVTSAIFPVAPGRRTHHLAKSLPEMALIRKSNREGDLYDGQLAFREKSFCFDNPSPHEISVRSHPHRKAEDPCKMGRTEMSKFCEFEDAYVPSKVGVHEI